MSKNTGQYKLDKETPEHRIQTKLESPTRRAVIGSLAATGAALLMTGGAAFADESDLEKRSKPTAKKAWDAIVIGAGVFGAWTAWNLLEQYKNVLLIDAWGPGHTGSSSGGESRLIRTEYLGDRLYTEMAWESLQQWQALSRRADQAIFVESGALYLYQNESEKIDKSLKLHEQMKIPSQRIERRQLAKDYPQLGLDGVNFGVLQPTMGALMARRSVQKVVTEFVAKGGVYRQQAISPPKASASMNTLICTNGEELYADQLIFACGAWLPKLFPDVVGTRIIPTKQEVFFFSPVAGDKRFDAGNFPAWVDASDKDLHYGFPVLESRGFKIALDVHGPQIDPDTVDRQISASGLQDVRRYLERRFPALAHRPLSESRVCQYENSVKGDFLIDAHPDWSNVYLVGGGSGHGFKHGPAVGRYTANLVSGKLKKTEPRFAYLQHNHHT